MGNVNNKGSRSNYNSERLATGGSVLTYRLGEKLVYVVPAENYEEALRSAYESFPKELDGIPSERINLTICAIVSKKHQTVHISAKAWPSVIPALAKFEIIDVTIAAEVQTPTYHTPSPASSPSSELSTIVEASEIKSFTDDKVSSRYPPVC